MSQAIENFNYTLYDAIARIIADARKTIYKSTNTILLKTYWEIAKLIIEDEQDGKNRAAYGKAVLKNLVTKLTLEFGKGFDESNLRNMRNFFLAFSIWDTVRPELSWTHYRIICGIDNQSLSPLLVNCAIEGNWNSRTLQRNVDSQYLGRMLKLPVHNSTEAAHFIKDPYLFEFLGLQLDKEQTETKNMFKIPNDSF
ncbi:DUF1016 N-terminal domain-containing protein [[Flexibacter] sp. ATCC 35208]|uniref:DUF1016 N-terminal domain-containing protein n=1 Tax=[Flexibacter] sp. ATCC 35208 TaxID=1936242 RepID=UPI0009C90214|nr:DUF1016 N-terminal domain-containing protein [[Flexibacter] sp. ATCC 35208]OMP77414.1 hypothetical protein BW716_20330 [[Flexibacter] sp. ATCC 35208]